MSPIETADERRQRQVERKIRVVMGRIVQLKEELRVVCQHVSNLRDRVDSLEHGAGGKTKIEEVQDDIRDLDRHVERIRGRVEELEGK